MDPDQRPFRPRRSFLGPIILIGVGVIFLLANLMPQFSPWELMFRYWPVILILVGLGKIWDYYSMRNDPSHPGGSEAPGIIMAVALLILVLALGVWHAGRRIPRNNQTSTQTQTVHLNGATAVTANLNFPAGQLNVKGGSGELLDADFRYSGNAPKVDYTVESGRGQLALNGNDPDHLYFGNDANEWDLTFNDAIPLDLTLQMGAGQSNLSVAELNLTHLEVHMGAGEVRLDLTGPRKQSLSAEIQGGVGQARIRLPKDVGVRARASGGIGSINVHGLKKQGDEYVNDAYGKTPTSIDLEVHGGIGQIDLDQE
jgi:hypothetical protein